MFDLTLVPVSPGYSEAKEAMLVKAELNYNQNISPDTCLSLTRFQPECLQYLESELLLGGGIDNKMDLTLGSFLLVFCHSSSATI